MHWPPYRAFIFSLATGFIPCLSSAQTPSACGATGGGLMVYASAKTHPPFSATIQITHEQKFADGNAIHGAVTTHEYRDSAGRMRAETALGCSIGPDGRLAPSVRVSIDDPVARTSISWAVDDRSPKVARVVHHPDPPLPTAAPPRAQTQVRPDTQQAQQPRAQIRLENLGSKMIAGVLADGSRTIRTVPAGAQGNDLPIETINEVWIAPDTGVAMLRIDDDPRNGRTTTEVTEFTQAEPDPSLFAPPPDYKLEEQVTRPVAVALSQ